MNNCIKVIGSNLVLKNKSPVIYAIISSVKAKVTKPTSLEGTKWGYYPWLARMQ